jgi:hypothetical protein
MESTTDTYYVLREGATQEEEWTWQEIEDRCRSGEFGADTKVYLHDESRWVRLHETDLAGVEPEVESQETDPEREALEREYAELLEGLSDPPSSVEPWIEAGSMACDLGDTESARSHFQAALDRHPFHTRVSHEVKRRFTPAECRSFRLMERPTPVWDNLSELLEYPLSRGGLYLAAPAALFGALLFLPGGGMVVGELALLWCWQALVSVSSGRSQPPAWSRTIADPLHRLALPAGALAGVAIQWLAVFWGVASMSMAAEGKSDVGVLSYIGASPVLTVAMALCALAYLPAVMISITPSWRETLRVLNPWFVVRSMIRMEMEYVMSTLLLFALAVLVGILGALTLRIPVAGKLVWAVALAFAVPACALVLGRLRSRTTHVRPEG